MPESNEAHSTPLKSHQHLLSGHQRGRHSSTFSHHRRNRGGGRLRTALGPRQPGMQALTPGATPPAPAQPLELTCPSPSPAVWPPTLLDLPGQSTPIGPRWAADFEDRPEGNFTCRDCWRNSLVYAGSPSSPMLDRTPQISLPVQCLRAPHLTNTLSAHTHVDLCPGCRVATD